MPESSSCRKLSTAGGSHFHRCSIGAGQRPLNVGRIDKVREECVGFRPSQCENPDIAHAQALGACMYRCGALQSCGCPEMDLTKNPHIKEMLHAKIHEAVGRLDLHQPTLQVTFFASGLLLNELNLLKILLHDLQEKGWEGELCLQFVDTKYATDGPTPIQKVWEDIQIGGDASVEIYTSLAALSGIVGTGALCYGIAQKKRQYAIGGVSALSAAGLFGYFASESMKQRANGPLGYAVKEITMKDRDAVEALKAMHQEMESFGDLGMKITTEFFASDVDCVDRGTKSDLLLGYDIEDTLPIVRGLYPRLIKEAGETIAVTKNSLQNGDVAVVFHNARGPSNPLLSTICQPQPDSTASGG